MKTKSTFATLLLCVFAFIPAVVHATTNDLTSLLQQGLMEEQANRNLDAAIADYQSLAAQFDKDRQIAATAIFRLGECYRMQNKTNEAAAQYQRILKDFSDQQTLATLSRQNLTGMGITLKNHGANENSDAKLWDKLKDLPMSEVEKLLPTLVPDAVLDQLLQSRNETETKLAQLKVDYAPYNLNVVRQQAALDEINRQIGEKIGGMLQGLKMRAEISPASPVSKQAELLSIPTTSTEDQEIQRIQTMIQNSPDLINAPDSHGHRPLENAAINGWLKVAAFLLDHGANINIGSALNFAANAGNRAMTEFLLSRGADINAKAWQGKTPLQTAVEEGFQSVTEVLLANKADVNAQDNLGNSPLITAVAHGQVKIVQSLLAAGANPNATGAGHTPLSFVKSDSPEITKLLLNAKADPNLENNDGRTPLSFAAGNGSPEMVKTLLAAKADPNGGTLDTPLLVAIHEKDTNSAEMLLQAGANPSAKGEVDSQIARSVENYGASTPLFFAVFTKQFPMVQLLLKYKADPDDSQMNGRAVIFSALNDTNILEALLDADVKVDPTSPDETQWTPLGAAAYQNYTAAVELLLKHGANPNVRNRNGATPLHWAAYNLAGTNVFQLLLDYKANPNVRSSNGETPLVSLKQWLTKNGVSVEQRILVAQLVDLLHQHGALDKLPDWNSITVSRPSENFSEAVFQKGTNNWNQFTLLEALFNFYGAGHTYSISRGNRTEILLSGANALPFPDLSQMTILRPSHDSTNITRIVVNLLNSTNGIDCAKDVPLQFGDVVEIPERDHALGENQVGLTASQNDTLSDYAKGSAKLIAHGQTVELPFDRLGHQATLGVLLERPAALKILLSSSDLSRVKVIRRDPKTGKSREWILDCRPPESVTSGVVLTTPISYQWFGANNSLPSTNLWLRDGDVIEVPEKP